MSFFTDETKFNFTIINLKYNLCLFFYTKFKMGKFI